MPAKRKPAKKKGPLVKGPKAESRKGFKKNIKTMEKAGYSKKRAVGTAYGEAYLGIDDMEKKDAKKRRAKAKAKSSKKKCPSCGK